MMSGHKNHLTEDAVATSQQSIIDLIRVEDKRAFIVLGAHYRSQKVIFRQIFPLSKSVRRLEADNSYSQIIFHSMKSFS